jgi:K+-sensing histidine kinase KdpD
MNMKIISAVHLLLLVYIIAALSFWWLSLEKQSLAIYDQEIAALNSTVSQQIQPMQYQQSMQAIALRKSTRSKQYMGEGLTFLVVILVGSSIVFTTYRLNNKLARQQNNFMLSVTHELKSPIAAIKLILQTLQKHQLEPEKQQQLLQKSIKESDRLNELCSNILIAAQVEGGQYSREWSLCNASDLVTQSVHAYQTRYPNRFNCAVAPHVQVKTDEMLLQLVLHNVLENAVKYTPTDTPIHVALHVQNNRVLLQVMDEGLGIADDEKKKVFDQFYRVGNENTRNAKGTGLGLYLSKKIMKYLKGNIVVKDNKPKGALFEISLHQLS